VLDRLAVRRWWRDLHAVSGVLAARLAGIRANSNARCS